ncbi:hypothetical protein E2C01_074424 [Portunus trituberculatus]|uniref:Uncharacterized protein n=1 Tax=Portunus trituberculatus TaxID=210409 RepID=A0A5B7I3B8_PORTR|nr:hypothetical protein [Portunus trituberculatus]
MMSVCVLITENEPRGVLLRGFHYLWSYCFTTEEQNLLLPSCHSTRLYHWRLRHPPCAPSTYSYLSAPPVRISAALPARREPHPHCS